MKKEALMMNMKSNHCTVWVGLWVRRERERASGRESEGEREREAASTNTGLYRGM